MIIHSHVELFEQIPRDDPWPSLEESIMICLLLQIWEGATKLQPSFAAIDRLVATNLKRVQQAFATAQVGPHHFAGSTGYGHGDLGRDALDRVKHIPPVTTPIVTPVALKDSL